MKRTKSQPISYLIACGLGMVGIYAAQPARSIPNNVPYFSVTVKAHVAANPLFLKTGDFNGDLHADVLVVEKGAESSSQSTITVFPGDGHGNLGKAVETLIDKGPAGIAVADFNSDGRPDVALVYLQSSAITLYLNQGDGSFQRKGDLPLLASPSPLMTGDFNGDGHADVAFSDATRNFVYFGNGDGSFQAIKISVGTGQAVADFNHDGKDDLASSTAGSWFSNGDGTFQTQPNPIDLLTIKRLITGDFNGDQLPDLADIDFAPSTVKFVNCPAGGRGTTSCPVYTEGYFHVGSILNPGDGVFTTSSITYPRLSGSLNPYPFLEDLLNPDNVIPDLWDVQTVDMNGDGRDDLLMGIGQDLLLYYGEEDGKLFPTLITVKDKPDSVLAARSEDFDEDGVRDVALLTPSGIELWRGHVEISAIFGPPNRFALPVDNSTVKSPLSVDDFNGDGTPDVGLPVIVGDQLHYAYIANKGEAAFVLGGILPETVAQYKQTHTPTESATKVSGDFNHDGIMDTAAITSDGTGLDFITVTLGTNDGSVLPPMTISPPREGSQGSHLQSLTAADFDGDGQLDLAVLNQFQSRTSLVVFHGKGDGSFQFMENSGLDSSSNNLVTADFNGDGKPDLAMYTYLPGTYTYVSGTLVAILYNRYQKPVPGDLNGDGSVTIGDAVLELQAIVGLLQPTSAQQALGDMNGDGKITLADVILLLQAAVGL